MTGEASDLAIVGGGVIGLSIAWHLARQGERRTVIYEGTGIGSGASSVQPGGVRQQWTSRVNCLMARESYIFYRDVKDRLETRLDPVLEQCGYLFVAESADVLATLADTVTVQNELGVPSRVLSPTEAAELVPGLDADRIVGATFCHEDGYFDKPQGVIEAFWEAAKREGVAIRHAVVTGLEQCGEGWRLRLANGGSAKAEHVVVAAGYDAPLLLAGLGVALPIRKDPRYLFYSDPIRERLLEPLVVSPERHFAAKQLADGSVLASDLQAAGDPQRERSRWQRRIREHIGDLLPILQYVPFTSLVEGFYDLTPDSLPILGAVNGFDGLWLAVGFSGRGFMMAPAVGRTMAGAVAAGLSSTLPPELRLDRFESLTHDSEALVV